MVVAPDAVSNVASKTLPLYAAYALERAGVPGVLNNELPIIIELATFAGPNVTETYHQRLHIWED